MVDMIKMEYESDESDGHSSSQSARRACEDSDSEEELVCELAKFSSQSSAYSPRVLVVALLHLR